MKTRIGLFTADINDEFLKIRKNLQPYLSEDSSVQSKKVFLSSYVPKEVVVSSEILLDTVINALMNEARSELKDASAELQNKFYSYGFRERIKERSVQVENQLSLESEHLIYSSDPQMKQGIIVGGITFIAGVAGVALTGMVFVPTDLICVIVGGIAILILSVVAFKLAYDKAESKAIAIMNDDIDDYLSQTKSLVSDWLGKVIESFENEFNSFCSNNGWGLNNV